MTIHYEKKTLANGLRVITAPMQETKAVTILIMIGTGSRSEERQNNGVAHFLEHMFFKGTSRRPSTLEISKELDALGADYNAFTGEEYTGFYVRVAADDFREAFDIITDMLLDPLFQVEEIEREKGVIVEELNMYEDTPMRAIHDQAKLLFYGDTPLGRNIGGKKETVAQFTREDFLAFRKRYYQPNNMILAIAGAGNVSVWEEELATKLGHLEGSADKDYAPATVTQTAPRVRLITKKTDQAHLIFGYHSFARTDVRRPILRVLQNILGGSMSSRLFIEVRERRGLAYYVRAHTWDFRDAGALVANAGVQVSKIDEAISVIREQFEKLTKESVSAEELERSQKNLRGSLYLGLEESMAIADFLTDQELLEEKIEQPEELVQKWNGVTREQMQSLAAELIRPSALNLTIIGPYDDASRFEKLVQ